MSEYWKSTPKYWCKHCKTFVRDTKLEKSNHEATGKHQGNLKRFLRDLHRGVEKDEKDKERAKNEVARLNGLATGSSSSMGGASSSMGMGMGMGGVNGGAYTKAPVPRPQVTEAQRKAQLKQLAEMGVAIPDEFRPDMAMAGEWTVTSERVIEPEGEKRVEAVAAGVRKRQAQDDDEEENETKRWRGASRYKTHPVVEDDSGLDALLSGGWKGQGKQEDDVEKEDGIKFKVERKEDGLEGGEESALKTEALEGEPPIPADIPPLEEPVKEEEAVPGIVFKKRKPKNTRQK